MGQRKEDVEGSLRTASVLMLDERDPIVTGTAKERAITTNSQGKVIFPTLTRTPPVMCTSIIDVNMHL